jgi:ParB family chromosome partitioning protein
MAVKREKVHFESVEELLGSSAVSDGMTEIRIDQIHSFKNHPFRVTDDEKMSDLIQSVKENGVLVPVMVRPDVDGSYEMISGHRRMHAARLAGLETIPALVRDMSDDEATIAMVDANLQREEILPSERAYSLKMKMDAMRHQGSCRHDVDKTEADAAERKTANEVGNEAGIGGRQVQRYIRLTQLVPELLDLVDQKQLSMVGAVTISYYDQELQKWIYEYIKEMGMIRPIQVEALKAQTNLENITKYTLNQILNDALPEKKADGKIVFSKRKLDKFFPEHLSPVEREEVIIRLLLKWSKEKNNM